MWGTRHFWHLLTGLLIIQLIKVLLRKLLLVPLVITQVYTYVSLCLGLDLKKSVTSARPQSGVFVSHNKGACNQQNPWFTRPQLLYNDPVIIIVQPGNDVSLVLFNVPGNSGFSSNTFDCSSNGLLCDWSESKMPTPWCPQLGFQLTNAICTFHCYPLATVFPVFCSFFCIKEKRYLSALL